MRVYEANGSVVVWVDGVDGLTVSSSVVIDGDVILGSGDEGLSSGKTRAGFDWFSSQGKMGFGFCTGGGVVGTW